jgi:hypothetical protein
MIHVKIYGGLLLRFPPKVPKKFSHYAHDCLPLCRSWWLLLDKKIICPYEKSALFESV